MSGRMVGILGGMGPEATLDLYREIVRLTPARVDQDHIRALIYSNPKIPDRTDAILGTGPDPLPALIESARLLERAGAGIVAIPCNAAHHFLPGLRDAVGIPVLDMIAEAAASARAAFPDAARAGILAATGTLRGALYRRACARYGMDLLEPGGEAQERIQWAVRQVKAGKKDEAVSGVFEHAALSLIENGADLIIMGCTEIPLALDPARVPRPALNPTAVLAQACVDWALRRMGKGTEGRTGEG